jgi:hypothetical protein
MAMTTTLHDLGYHSRAADAAVVERGGVPVRFARVQAVRGDGGEVVDLRTDAEGRVALTRLEPGRWTLLARDARRTTCSGSRVVDVAHTRAVHTLTLTGAPTGELLVDVRDEADRPATSVATVVVTDADGVPAIVALTHGAARVRGLRPGPHRVVVPASLGHRGTVLDEVAVLPGALVACVAHVRHGGLVEGRVVQSGAPQYAAPVVLLDADGTELERTRTRADGRFLMGTGLPSSRGMTLVATSGPRTLHVTSAAVADVVVLSGTRRDVGDVHLPVAGPDAHWAGRTRAVAGMKLPSTRL